MLESIIFHFVFVLFVVWAFVWWLMTTRRFDLLRNSLLPAILLKKIEFPQDRSLVVRSLGYLQEELSNLFQCKTNIACKFPNLSPTPKENFLLPLCYLIWEKDFLLEKSFLFNEKQFSSKEFISYVKLEQKKKSLTFNYDFENNIWNVEIGYET